MDKTRYASVKRKVSKHVVILMIGTIVFLTVINLAYMTQRIVAEQQVELDLATRLTAQQVDDWAQDMMTVTEDMAGSLTALGALDEVTVRGVIDRVALNHPEYYYVYFSDKLGNITMARGVSFAEGVDPRTRPWYKMAEAKGHSVVLDPYISASSPDVMMATVATPVYWGSMLVGVVAVDAEISSIKSFMNSIDFEEGAYGFLIDSSGDIIVHPNESYNQSTENVTRAVDVMPELEKLLNDDSRKIRVAKDYKGISMVYSKANLTVSGWTVVVAYPEKNVVRHVTRGMQISIAIALLCIIVALLDVNRITKKVLNPINKIKPAMEKIMKGDFSANLDFATANDEIGEMQNTLAMMIGELTDILETQKRVLGEMERGNLMVEDIDELPGEFNSIATAVNSIKETFNDMVSDIQFSALNLQSFAMGVNETSDLEEMKLVFEELSAEANVLMEKTSKFITVSTPQSAGDGPEVTVIEDYNEYDN